MEFPSVITENLGGIEPPWVVAIAPPLALLAVADARRIRVRVKTRPRPRRLVTPLVTRAASLLGLALAMTSHPAAAGTRKPVSPHRPVTDAAPPWSEAGGFPPPRPLARTEGGADERPVPHPALHGKKAAGHKEAEHLFPRRTHRRGRSTMRRNRDGASTRTRRNDELAAAMARHPSGRVTSAGEPDRSAHHHVVRAGESLWTIAEEVLGTDDPRAVARYWPRIHRLNRAAIGRDPSIIRPGQVLELPVFGREEH